MKNKIIFYLILNFLIIEINSIQIHPLNEINQTCTLDVNDSIDYYYFYTSVANEKVNEHISYFISNEITEFKISYIFLEKDSYEDLTDSDVNNYSFNEDSEFMNWKNFFKTIFKTDNKQKGLLLKMKIIKSAGNSFNISRINLTLIEPHDITILIPENQTNYFYIDPYYFQESDVLIFSSYGKERIKEYYIPDSIVYESDNKKGLLFFDDNDDFDYILYISNNHTESIYINIKFLPKNVLIYNSKFGQEANIEQIQLSIENSVNNEIYYLKNQKEYNFFLREISGTFEASFIYLEDINNLDEVFPDQNNKMVPFNGNIIHQDDKTKILMHFKSINNNSAIFELISLCYYITYRIAEGSFIFSYLKEKSNTYILDTEPSGNNISTYIEYFGCKLEDDDEIRIDFGENNLITFNKTVKKGWFNIHLILENNKVYSDKNCELLLNFGKNEISPNIIEESFNNSLPKTISYQYPNIEEDVHYNLYFFNSENGQIYRPSCSFYYVNTDFIFIHYHDSIADNLNILMNPYKSLETDHNLTFLMNCQQYYGLNPILFHIIKLKQEDGILNIFFSTGTYTEYKFKKTNKTTKILIQLIGKLNYIKNEYPTLHIGKYSRKIYDFSHLFVVSNEIIPKIVINGANIVLKINYIEKDIDLHSKILNSNKDFNITSEEAEIYKLKIRPLFYNEDIQYTIHAYTSYIFLFGEKEKYYSERLYENFGDISVNTTFVKKSLDVFEYTLDLTDKINSSYQNFIIIAKDLKTGYASYYTVQTCDYKKKDNSNTTLIVVSVVVSVIVVFAVVVTIFILRRRKKDKNELNVEEREMLMK